MTGISTLTGTVSPEDLGVVALHEHLLFGLPGWHCAPEVEFDRAFAFERLVGELAAFRKAGGRTLVDMSGLSLGRNVPFYKRLAEVSGVRIVASTGFGSQEASIPAHFRTTCFFYRGEGPLKWKREIPGHFAPSHIGSAEYMMFLFYNELTEGMAAPAMMRTKVKAGLTRTGSAWGTITMVEELAIRGAAMAARKAGASVYTDSVNQARRQFECMTGEGLAPERMVIGHCDDARALDLERDREFAAQGATVAYDHIGWEDGAAHALPDERRVALVKEMVAAGFADRVVLSCSAVGYGLGARESRHGYAHLLNGFVPRLAKAGIGEAALQAMLVENPKRILSFGKGEEA